MAGRDDEVEVQLLGLLPRDGDDAGALEEFGHAVLERVGSAPAHHDLHPEIAVEHRQHVEQPRDGGDVVRHHQHRALRRDGAPLPGLDADWHFRVRTPAHSRRP
ncbi:hypothetical protein LZ318_34260 [Saccharopolyspora indica]|uniref:hypothetical protein n=1 Tax=Saccharopolyspora indica TaxID=1229659 RepID=UPI0022EB1925|nr:hypothetical protein [Saccharopolyspora indica]MDA3647532.1 hypothetical protein [Saccharopolyspora indica]